MEGFVNKSYVVDKVLRKRPLGNVYKARRVSDGVLCAIKELDVRHMSEEEKEDAMEEIRVLATVRNENVISYYDAFAAESKLYVVMEYCDEPDLGRHIKTRAENQKFFSEAQIWSYLIQMLRGLVAVHSRGLIHRDVRSGNIIQLDSSAVKIGDIRVGKVLKEGLVATPDIENPHCVPPEVWQNKAYTFKSDVWAVGCVLYEMITLAVPFGGCSLPDLRAKVIQGQCQPIPTSFSTGLSNVLKLLLNPDQATRISARDMLSHPLLQAHLHYAPAPAPMLRVRASREKNKLGSIPAPSSFSVGQKTSYPTLVVPGHNQQLHGQAPDSKKGVAEPPENNRHQAGLSSERPTAPAARSRVVPILAPRAVLSSRDNDEMLAGVNGPSNQASKVKVPRVAMLSKVIPKSPTETSVTPSPQGVPSTPRVNMKHFKTAYILSPKVDPDEFQTTSIPDDRSDVSRREKVENLVNGPGIRRSKSVATPPTPKVVTPIREKSMESLRSVGSSRSDDSSIRVRAPIDTLDPSHTESATPRRQTSLESARSVTSSRSGDSVIQVRAPVDFSDAPQANVVTDKGDSFRSGTSAASSRSNGSAISVRAAITDLDPARPLPISDDLQIFLTEDGGVPHQAPESVTHFDGLEPSQRPNELGGSEGLVPDCSRMETLDSSTHTSRASRTRPVANQTKATTPNRNIPGALDGVARRTSGTHGSGGKALGDALDRRLPNSRNRRLSFDGTGTERPLANDHSKLATPNKRESSMGIRRPAAVNGVAMKDSTDSVTPVRTQGSGTGRSHVTRPSTAPQKPPSDSTEQTLHNGDRSGVLPRRHLTTGGKDVKESRGNCANTSNSVSTVAQSMKKSSDQPSKVTRVSQAKKQGANSVNGGSTTGAVPTQSPQIPIRSRRLSLDFPTKGKGAKPIGSGVGHITGTAS